MDRENKFAIQYVCNNCSNEFEEKYCRGDEVEGDCIWKTIVLKNGYVSRAIRCPICDSERVNIKRRYPLP